MECLCRLTRVTSLCDAPPRYLLIIVIAGAVAAAADTTFVQQ